MPDTCIFEGPIRKVISAFRFAEKTTRHDCCFSAIIDCCQHHRSLLSPEMCGLMSYTQEMQAWVEKAEFGAGEHSKGQIKTEEEAKLKAGRESWQGGKRLNWQREEGYFRGCLLWRTWSTKATFAIDVSEMRRSIVHGGHNITQRCCCCIATGETGWTIKWSQRGGFILFFLFYLFLEGVAISSAVQMKHNHILRFKSWILK